MIAAAERELDGAGAHPIGKDARLRLVARDAADGAEVLARTHAHEGLLLQCSKLRHRLAGRAFARGQRHEQFRALGTPACLDDGAQSRFAAVI